ncbi:F-box protein SKIP27 [Ricinus communis]|uniref:F-box protein SKIP27 n=1 Tax=Ricinus communis TaxID=3988 RepID=UPI000772578D|nr:F-box protein SKIP27 [Ricinus communis]|eukprot:XP_015578154.1 F-box protein SKIP27 [Ricinus communis]
MALGKRSNSMKLNRAGVDSDEAFKRLGCVRYTRSFGRKRIVISNAVDLLTLDSPIKTPLKRLCSLEPENPIKTPLKRLCSLEPEKSTLETLPQDILVRVLCCVNHDDLKQLFHVSTAIREATLVARKLHFAYSTPRKIPAFRTPIASTENPTEFDEFEAPNAPKVSRCYKSRLNRKNLMDISVALFASPRKGLFMETEV